MRPVVTDGVARSVCLSVGQLVCTSVTIMSPAEMDEPIEMPFGMWTLVGPRNHELDGGAYWLRRCGLMSNYFDHLLYISDNISKTV